MERFLRDKKGEIKSFLYHVFYPRCEREAARALCIWKGEILPIGRTLLKLKWAQIFVHYSESKKTESLWLISRDLIDGFTVLMALRSKFTELEWSFLPLNRFFSQNKIRVCSCFEVVLEWVVISLCEYPKQLSITIKGEPNDFQIWKEKLLMLYFRFLDIHRC